MNNKTVSTYSLLTHLKETRFLAHSSIAEIFFPIVKKAIVEYSQKKGVVCVKGRDISEIKEEIVEFFGIEIPISVLDFILSQIKKEISDDNKFAYYNDKSFIINSYVFNEIDDDIYLENQNIKLLKDDFENFCDTLHVKPDFDDLIKFICSQQIELFSEKKDNKLDFEYYIPKYIGLKFSDEKMFKIISDVYLGSIISSYFTYKIQLPVTNTELLIDTNFFISLINLNTIESCQTCNQLFEICNRLGYKFTVLYSTIEQIKALLNSRIQDFANKDLGLIKEADVFGACIRRKLDKSQLERIKDGIVGQIEKYNISIIHEAQINDIIKEAKKSYKYKEILQIRNNQALSALNDTIAYFYVLKKRGDNISEFSEVKCWFLNNTFHSDYYFSNGYKLHERYKISANELLSLLWLSNPNQEKLDLGVLSKGGLATYIAKYKQHKVPSVNTLKAINKRAKDALKEGFLTEKDVFAVSIRMAEGQLTNGEATNLSVLSDEEFIKTVQEHTQIDKDLHSKVDKQLDIITEQTENIRIIEQKFCEALDIIKKETYKRNKEMYAQKKILETSLKMNRTAWLYLVFLMIICGLWILNYLGRKFLGDMILGIVSFVFFVITFLIRFVDHKSVLDCLRFTFFKRYRLSIIERLQDLYETEFEKENKRPI